MRAPCRVVLTRTPADNARLRAALGSVDAEVVDYPCIAIEPIPFDAGIAERLLSRAYGSVFFVSKNAVEHLLSRVAAPAPARAIALGDSTASSLESRGWSVSARPTESNMESVLEELDRLFPDPTERVLYVRGELGEDTLPRALRKRGHLVDVAVVYSTRDGELDPLPSATQPTLVVFASPSAVRHFVARNGSSAVALAIGDTTAKAARVAGMTARVSFGSSTDGIASAIRLWLLEQSLSH